MASQGDYYLRNSNLQTVRSPDGLNLPFQVRYLRTAYGVHPKPGDFHKLFETACKVPITSLELLQISSGTQFDSEKARHDAEETFIRLRSIKQFKLNSLVLSNRFLVKLAKKAAYFSSTKEIHLKNVYLDSKLAIQFAKALSKCSSFERLHLWNIGGVESSGSFFYNLSEVRSIVFEYVTKRVEDFFAFAKAKKHNIGQTSKTSLTVLGTNFEENIISFLKFICNFQLGEVLELGAPAYVSGFWKGNDDFRTFVIGVTNMRLEYPYQHGKYLF